MAELRAVLSAPGAQLNDDLACLREYHLLAVKGDTPIGGSRIIAPHGVQMLSAVLADRLIDPRRVERECKKIRQGAPNQNKNVAQFVHRVVGCWKNNESNDALEIAKVAVEKFPQERDLLCLLGRAYLRVEPEDARRAEVAFRKGHGLGCRRNELFPLWIEARSLLEDWRGVVELCNLWEKQKGGSADILLIRAQAFDSWASAALQANNPQQAAALLREGGADVQKGFERGYASGRVFELKEIKKNLLQKHFALTWEIFHEQEEGLEVWLAMVEVFKNFVRGGPMIRTACARLDDWFRAKETKANFEPKSAEAVSRALEEIREIITTLSEQSEPDRLLIGEPCLSG